LQQNLPKPGSCGAAKKPVDDPPDPLNCRCQKITAPTVATQPSSAPGVHASFLVSHASTFCVSKIMLALFRAIGKG